MNPLTAVIIVVGVLGLVLVIVSRSRGSNDGVDSFRRQIDALSPEARRPVIDQMYSTTERTDPHIEPRIDTRPADSGGEAASEGGANDRSETGADEPGADEDGADEPGADEDGAHGA